MDHTIIKRKIFQQGKPMIIKTIRPLSNCKIVFRKMRIFSTVKKNKETFIPKVFALFRRAASFETSPVSISSILVESGTFDYGIAFPGYVIKKI